MSRRGDRVAEEIRMAVAEMIGSALKDPRIGFVTVTRVTVTDDLRMAHVNVGVLGKTAQREETLVGLRQAAGFMRRELGRRLRMRHTPELVFHYDHGLDAADTVDRLLREGGSSGDRDPE